MDQTDKAPKSQEIIAGNEQSRPGWGRSLKRFVFICLYVAFLAAVVFGVLAALEYYAYLCVKASPVGQAYKGRDMDLARQSSQKVAPQVRLRTNTRICHHKEHAARKFVRIYQR